MELKGLFPSKDQITNLKDIESVLLSRKTNGKIAGWVALLSALVQFAIILWPFFKNILGFKQAITSSPYFQDLKTLIPFVLFILGISVYLILRRTGVLLKETREPFRYTLSVKPFLSIGNIPESDKQTSENRFNLKNKDRLLLLHHDLTELINQRIKRFSIIPHIDSETHDKKEDNKDASVIDKRKSSHIDIFGTYAVREDKENDEWIIHVMPYVRIGAPESAATLAQSIRFSLSKDETPDTFDTDEYNQLVERVYSRVTTEIYDRIEKDIHDKIELFPTRYLKVNALYHEARDMANSNTINAFESAINLYNKSIGILRISLSKILTGLLINVPLLKLICVRYLFQYAKIYTGHAKCLIYKYRISTLSGRKRSPIYEILPNLEHIIRDLELFYYSISKNSDISGYIKNNNRSYSILAYLTYHEDSFLRQLLFKPSQSLFAETRVILFNAYVVHSLTDSLLNAFVSAKRELEKAKAIAPDLCDSDSLYYLALAYSESNVDRALLLFQRATEIAPSFQIAQYDLAFWLEMKFRMNDEIRYNRARTVLDEYDKVLRINPGNIAALAAQGYIYWLLYDLVEAKWLETAKRKFEEGFEIKVIASETFIGQLMYGCARIFAEQGKINKCYDLFNQAFSINPNLGSYTVGEDSWLPCSFYDYIDKGLLNRYQVYFDTYDKFFETKKFLFGKIGNQNIDELDKNELSGDLKKILKKTGINLSEKIKIISEEPSRKWIINGDENSDPIHISLDGNDIEIYSLPDVSDKALNTVYSYILNDYANANYNFYRRNGNDSYLKKAIDLYSAAINKFPNNSISKFNKSSALLEQNKTEDSAILLDEVLENRPAWYEALIASVSLNLDLPDKIDKIKKDNAITHDAISELKTTQNNIQDLNNEIKKLQEKCDIINDLIDSIRHVQENTESLKILNDQIKNLQQKSETTKNLTDQINVLQKDSEVRKIRNDQIRKKNAITQDPDSELKSYEDKRKKLENDLKKLQLKSERVKILGDEIKKLEERIVGMKIKIRSSLDTTKLSYFYDSKYGNISHINQINKKSIKWIRLDEDDVHALKLYSKYEKQNQSELFSILLKYYCPEDVDINLNIIRKDPESMNMLESNIRYWLDQDPSNYYVYRQYRENLVQLYSRYLKDYIKVGCERLLKQPTPDEPSDTEIEKFFKEFEKSDIFKDNPNRIAYVYYEIGKSLAKIQNSQVSFEILTKATDFNKIEPEYYYELGSAYSNDGKWNTAIGFYKKAIETKKKLPDYPYGTDIYYNYLSEAYFRADNLNGFEEFVKKSGDLDDKPDKKAIVYNYIGNLLANALKEQEAIPFYKNAIEYDPNRPIYRANLGLTYTKLEQYNEAIEYYKNAIDLCKKSPDDQYGLDYFYDFLSEVYFKAGKLNEFLVIFDKSGDLNDKPDKKAIVYNRIGNLLVDSTNEEDAVAFYRKAIEHDPNSPIYLCNLGLTYANIKQLDEAIIYHKKAIELRKKSPDDQYGLDYYYQFLSEAYFKAGKVDDFLDFFEKSGDLNDKLEKKAIIYNRIGNLLLNSGNGLEAITYYKKALEHDQNMPVYLSNLGLTYAKLEQWNEAIQYYNEAIELSRKYPDDQYDLDYYYNNLSEAYFNIGKINELLDIFEKSGDLNDRKNKKAVVYNRIGNLFADSIKKEEAIQYYKKAIEYDPNSPIYYCNLGLTYEKIGKWEEAIEFYKQATKLREKSPDDQYALDYYYDFLSEAYFKTGDMTKCLEIIEGPVYANNPVKKAIIYNIIGNSITIMQEAIPYYKKALEYDPNKPIYQSNLGLAYTKLEQWNEAIEYYKKAIELSKKYPDDQYGLDYYYDFLSEAYFKAGNLYEFLEFFEKSGDLIDKPDKKAIIYNRIANLYADSINKPEAVAYYKKAIEQDPNRPIYLCNLGLTYTRLEQWNEAIEYYKKAIELRKKSPDDQSGLDYYYDLLAEAYFKAGNLNEFLEIFEKSGDLNDEPDKKAIIYNRIGNLLINSPKAQEAIPYYKKAIEQDPNRPIYLCNLGLTYTRLEQWYEAIEYYNKAIELRKKSPDDQSGLDYYYDLLSEAYFKAGNLNEFLEIFEKSGDLNDEPDKKAIIYNRIGNLYADSINKPEAIPYYKKAIEKDPNRPIYLCNLGLTYSRLEQWNEAIEYYKKAVELRKHSPDDPYDADYYNYFLSEAYDNIGRKDP